MHRLGFGDFCRLLSSVYPEEKAKPRNVALFDAVKPATQRYAKVAFPNSLSNKERYNEVYANACRNVGIDGYAGDFEQNILRRMGKGITGRGTDYDADRIHAERLFYFFLCSNDCGDSVYGDQICIDLFNNHFWDCFDEEMVALGVDRPKHLTPIRQAKLGPVTISLGAARHLVPLEINSIEDSKLMSDGRPHVFRALEWRADLSKLRGRKTELDSLVSWAIDDEVPKARIMLISGPGGSGKTRLAAEFAYSMVEDHNWKAGFLPNEYRDQAKAKDFIGVLAGSSVGTLLIIDYPEEKTYLVEEIYKSIKDKQKEFSTPLRLVLASRENSEAWAERLRARFKSS